MGLQNELHHQMFFGLRRWPPPDEIESSIAGEAQSAWLSCLGPRLTVLAKLGQSVLGPKRPSKCLKNKLSTALTGMTVLNWGRRCRLKFQIRFSQKEAASRKHHPTFSQMFIFRSQVETRPWQTRTAPLDAQISTLVRAPIGLDEEALREYLKTNGSAASGTPGPQGQRPPGGRPLSTGNEKNRNELSPKFDGKRSEETKSKKPTAPPGAHVAKRSSEPFRWAAGRRGGEAERRFPAGTV